MNTTEQHPWTTERGATIDFTDTISDVLTPIGAPPIVDFDSPLTRQARGKSLRDAEYPIGAWPHTASYAGVLLADLSVEQGRILDVYENHDRADLPDAVRLREDLATVLVGVLNSAPRRSEHQKNGKNGDDFYLAELNEVVTVRKIQLFSQASFLEGVAARGLVKRLWRVLDDNPIWPKGEQFRSSIVDQLRNFPESLEVLSVHEIEKAPPSGIQLAYADKYGNCRLEVPAGLAIPEIATGDKLAIRWGKETAYAVGAHTLTQIPEGSLGIYYNPADVPSDSNTPRYIELARKTGKPNDPRDSAYAALSKLILNGAAAKPEWKHIEFELVA